MTNTNPISIDPVFDTLIRATEQIKYPVLPDLDDIEVSVDGRTFPSVVIEQVQDPFTIRLTCRDDKGDFYRTDMGRYGDIAPVFLVRSADGFIDLDGGFLSGQNGILDFRTWKQKISNDDVAATVWVLVGGRTAVDFPDPIPVPKGLNRPWFMERGLRCTIGGAPALIRRAIEVSEFPTEESSAFVIARLGACNDGDFLASLRVVLSMIFGTWLEPAIQYHTRENGASNWRRVDRIYPFIKRDPTPAIRSVLQGEMRAAGDQLGTMLARCDELLSQNVRLDVALQYLLGSHDGTEAEIRDMCSAIDAVAESPLLELASIRFIDDDRFLVVRENIDKFLAQTLPPREALFRKRVGEVLTLARTESSSKKQKMLWQATHIEIRKTEREALEHRHDMAHKGYIPFDYDDNAQWRLIFERSGLLRTLANRMLLSVLGFHGDSESYHAEWDTAVVPVTLNANGRIGDAIEPA